MSNKKECDRNVKKTSIGGQALIEGIMMRGPQVTAMAVRNPEGKIVLEKWETKSAVHAKFFKLPLVRGVVGFINSMVFGYKCLMRSAEIAGLEELENAEKSHTGDPVPGEELTETAKSSEAAEMAENIAPDGAVLSEEKNEAGENVSADDKNTAADVKKSDGVKEEKKAGSSALMNTVMVIASVLGVALAVLLFLMLPSYIYKWISSLIPALKPDNLALSSLIKSVFEGVLKIAVLVAYMSLVTLMKDIRRTFQYHGAEHKTIFCYEHGKELTVENVRNERRFHPRCGTSFLILMLLVGMFISFFIDPLFYLISGALPPTIIRVVIKLLMIPLIMGIGYELIKLAGRHDNLFTRIISAPGMWLQHITVLEPDDSMIECAIAAFKEVIPPDGSDNF